MFQYKQTNLFVQKVSPTLDGNFHLCCPLVTPLKIIIVNVQIDTVKATILIC